MATACPHSLTQLSSSSQMRLLLSAWDGECLTKQQLVSAYVSVQCSVQMAEYTGIDQYGKRATNGLFPVDTWYILTIMDCGLNAIRCKFSISFTRDSATYAMPGINT